MLDETALFARIIMAGWGLVFIGCHLEIALLHAPWRPYFFMVCPFRAITGIECPGCGMTRAFVHLARLDLAGAFLQNPWSLPLFLYLALEALGLGRHVRRRIQVLGPWILGAIMAWWLLFRVAPFLKLG